MALLEVLTKQFGSKTALETQGFHVERPYMFGVIGRSGAG